MEFDALTDARRLAAVRSTGLLDSPAEEAFDRLTRLAAAVLRAPMSFVTLLDDQRMYFKSRVGVDAQNLPLEESFCQYVVADDAAFLTGHAAIDPRSMHNPSINTLGIAAYAGVPFRSRNGQVLGAFCVADGQTRDWSIDDLATLTALAEVASNEVALRENYHLAVEFASTLQRSLLPPLIPAVSGLDIATAYIPAHDGFSVLGDFYDVFETSPNRWFVVLGDVRGHGPPAAETVALVRWSIRAVAARTANTDSILRSVNDQLMARTSPDAPHLTCVLLSVDTASGAPGDLWLSSAGHPPALVVRAAGGVHTLPPSGRPLGVVEDPATVRVTLDLRVGDSLVLLTDGVTEAGRVRGAQLGHEGVEQVLQQLPADSSAREIVDLILDAVRTADPGAPADDVALVVLRRAG